MNFKKIFYYSIVALSSVGCTAISQKTPLEQWKNFEQVNEIPTDARMLQADRALVVFLRDAGQVSGPALNIFIDGEYLTSLQDGGHKVTSVCAAHGTINASFTDTQSDYYQIRQQQNVARFKAGSVNFIRFIPQSDGVIQLQPVDEVEAKALLPRYLEQINTISRVDEKKACPEIIQKLVSVSLFAFDKAGMNDILQGGYSEISSVAKSIIAKAESIDYVSVIGHTDPEGNSEYNFQLSLDRANTVRGILENSGIKNQKINTEGRGETELVITDCEAKFANNKAELEKCNLPNRRVEIISYEIKP